MEFTETNHGTGAIPDPRDKRDFQWGNQIGNVSVPFDWEKGFDIEEELRTALNDPSFKLPANDQNGSGSCGGQAISKKGEVLSALNKKKFVRKSAKFPYAQVHSMPSGSGARPLFDIYNKQGMGREDDVISYENGKPPSEPFMQRKQDITDFSKEMAQSDKSSAYAQTATDIDSVAQAIRDSKGAIIGIYGKNNGTWRTAFPLPPTEVSSDCWAHWVFCGKAKIINGKKYIGFLNSWGKDCGDGGWQYIGEEYFNNWIWASWTFLYEVPSQNSVFSRTIRFRMRGDDVKCIQRLLNINADGIFGKMTLARVKTFQQMNGLLVDGIVGPKTQAKLLELDK